METRSTINAILSKFNGTLAEKGYILRAPQKEMLEFCCAQWEQGKGAIAEAPTGTGKSFVYLFLASQYAFQNKANGVNKCAVISTCSRALQDQVERDFKIFQEMYPHIKYAVWKGAANYLCVNRLYGALANPPEYFEPEDMEQLQFLEELLEEVEDTDGSREKMPFKLSDRVWNRVCSNGKCCTKDSLYPCYKKLAYKRAERSQVLCVNHTLLATTGIYGGFIHPAQDLSSRIDCDGVRLIIDEAHELLPSIRNAINTTYSLSTIKKQISRLSEPYKTLFSKELLSLTSAFSDLLYEGEKVVITRDTPKAAELTARMATLMLGVSESANSAQQAQQSELLRRYTKSDLKNWETDQIALSSGGNKLLEYVTTFPHNAFLTLQLQNGKVVYDYYPFEFTPELQGIYRLCEAPPIFTSATLVPIGAKEAMERLQVTPENVSVKIIQQGYDYLNTVKGYIPKLKDARDPEELAQWLRPIIELTLGNTLVLFTSYKTMFETADKLGDLQEKGYTFCVQEPSLNSNELITKYKKSTRSVLFGNVALWSGIDIKGSKLSNLVITKLPFHNVDEYTKAYSEYLEEKGESPFYKYMLPEMLDRFKQGLGRLKRDAADKGLIWLLDPKISTASYRAYVIDKLPVMKWKVLKSPKEIPEPEPIRKWLGISESLIDENEPF